MFRFLPQQQVAIDHPGNVAVSAGAGSGKTRVLVEKYFRLLAEEHPEWPIQSVVAITFTIKAASELKSRIVQRIMGELNKNGTPPEKLRRLQEMRQQLSEAPIGTIHNFCARLLREVPLQANLSPDFSIIEGPDELALRRETIERAIVSMAQKSASEYDDLLQLLMVYPQKRLFELLDTMLRRRAEFSIVAGRYAQLSVADLLHELEQVYANECRKTRDRLAAALTSVLQQIRSCQGIPPQVSIAAKQLDAALAAFNWNEICPLAASLQDLLFTKSGELRRNIENCTSLRRGDKLVSELFDLCKGVDRCSSDNLSQPDRENLAISRCLARVYLDVERRYHDARRVQGGKAESDLLDFADLELCAERLIAENAEVRTALRSAIKYMIIDEFQDTSVLQWKILAPNSQQ